MILYRDIDGDRAQVFLGYLAESTRRVTNLDDVRNRFLAEMNTLREETKQKSEEELTRAHHVLERALAKEKALLQEHQASDVAIAELEEKINIVMNKLDRVLGAPSGRVLELKSKVHEHALPHKEKIAELKTSIRTLEKTLRELPKHKQNTKRTQIVRERLKAMKKELKGK